MTVYFIEGGGLVKIGYTAAESPEERLSTLQTGSPARLELLAFCDGDQSLERQLHELLADARSHNEWFRPTRRVCAAIELARVNQLHGFTGAGEHSVSTLLEATGVSAKQTQSLKKKRSEAERRRDLKDSECWAITLALWSDTAPQSPPRQERDWVCAGSQWQGPNGVHWDTPEKPTPTIERSAEHIADLVKLNEPSEHLAAFWLAAVAHELRCRGGAPAETDVVQRGCRYRLRKELGSLWHQSAQLVLPVRVGMQSQPQTMRELAMLAHGVRGRLIETTTIIDARHATNPSFAAAQALVESLKEAV